jgi:hypothetical protein
VIHLFIATLSQCLYINAIATLFSLNFKVPSLGTDLKGDLILTNGYNLRERERYALVFLGSREERITDFVGCAAREAA